MEENVFESIGSDEPSLEEEELNDVTFDLELPPPRITSYGGDIRSLEDAQAFLDYKGHSKQATMTASAIGMVRSLYCTSYSLTEST